MECAVVLSANAGVSVTCGGKRLLVDALHTRKTPEFSTLTPELAEAVLASEDFSVPSAVVYTHVHRDHYDPELTARFLRKWPGTACAAPFELPGGTVLRAPAESLSPGGVPIRFAAMLHAGGFPQPNYGLVADVGGARVLFAGDARVCAPELPALLEGGPIDLAVLNFPWITLSRGRKFVEERIRPAHLLLFHLPFAGDDLSGYRAAAEKALPLVRLDDVRLLDNPLQREIVRL